MSDSIQSLHIIGGKKLGGAERFFIRLINALKKHGEQVEVVIVPGSEIDSAIDPSIPRHYVGMAGVLDIWSGLRIRWIVEKRKPRIVQTYMGRATRLTHLKKNNTTIHVARLGGYYDIQGYRHAHAWIGNTQGICDYLKLKGLPPEQVFHIGNFADASTPHTPESFIELREEWNIPINARVILGLGRLHPNKGFTDLLHAFSKLPARLHGFPLWLVLVGDGPLKSNLQNEARQLGIQERITWTGWQFEPSRWYQLADVFVCCSRHEPLGNVILEAWANSTPIVTTAAEGPLEIVSPGQDAVLTPLRNPPLLATNLLNVLNLDHAEKNRMTQAGLAKLSTNYSEEAIVLKYIELYRELVERRNQL